MNVSFALQLPCQKKVYEEMPASYKVRVTLIALCTIALIVSVLILCRIPHLNQLGTTSGWVVFSFGSVILLFGLVLRAVKKESDHKKRTPETPVLSLNTKEEVISETVTSVLPDELLKLIFSFLKPKALVGAALVCKRWNQVQTEEDLWKRHCFTYLSYENPSLADNHTWKIEYKTLSNWMAGRAAITTYPSVYKRPHISHDFTLLADGKGLHVYPDLSGSYIVSRITQYTRYDIVGNTACLDVVAHVLCDEIYSVLDSEGKIFCYNVLSRECVKTIFPKEKLSNKLTSNSTRFYCNKDEAIVWYRGKIAIVNLNDETSTLFDCKKEVWHLHATTNFVVIETAAHQVVRVHKIDGSQNPVSEEYLSEEHLKAGFHYIKTSGPYLAVLGRGGIKIFKDVGRNLIFLHRIQGIFQQPISHFGSLHIFKNWLMVSRNGILKIWEIETGTLLSSINHGLNNIEFYANGSQLLLRRLIGDPHLGQDYSYTLLDFSSKKATVIPNFFPKKNKWFFF